GIIAEDDASVLLLLEGIPGLPGLEVATSVDMGDPVRTFTHGHGMPTYKTSGILLKSITTTVNQGMILTEEDAQACIDRPRRSIVPGLFGSMCISTESETVSPAAVVPGSSGGMVVDDMGRLVGVVSATDGTFGFFVPLSDVKAFLAKF